MESYLEVRNSFDAFLGNVIHEMATRGTYTNDAETIQVEGTSYQEISANQSLDIELKEYQTEVLVHHNEIKALDLTALRNRIFQAAKKETRDMNKDFLNVLESKGLLQGHSSVQGQEQQHDFISLILKIISTSFFFNVLWFLF